MTPVNDALAALRARTLGRCGDPGSYERRWAEGLLPLVEAHAVGPDRASHHPVLLTAIEESIIPEVVAGALVTHGAEVRAGALRAVAELGAGLALVGRASCPQCGSRYVHARIGSPGCVHGWHGAPGPDDAPAVHEAHAAARRVVRK